MKCIRCSREALPGRKRCRICLESQRSRGARWFARHGERIRDERRRARSDIRRMVLEHYGGVCACCGETEPAFLTIDHINNDGAAHRRAIGATSASHFAVWLYRHGYPDGFQVLCANCNHAKAVVGTCPHHPAPAPPVGGEDQLTLSGLPLWRGITSVSIVIEGRAS